MREPHRLQDGDLVALIRCKMDHHQPCSLEQLVLQRQLIPQETLTLLAEERQVNVGLRLIDQIRQHKLIPEELLGALQADQMGLPWVSIRDLPPDEKALQEVSADGASRHCMLPLAVVDGYLVLAIADPANTHGLKEIEFTSHYPLFPVIAPAHEINELAEKFYRPFEEQRLLDRVDNRNGDSENASVYQLQQLEQQANQEPLVQLVNRILTRAIQCKASDIHLRPTPEYFELWYRIDGEPQLQRKLEASLNGPLTNRIKIMGDIDIAERRRPQDGHASIGLFGRTVDLRISIMPTVDGESVVIRILDRSNAYPSLEGLQLPEEQIKTLYSLLHQRQGIFLCTGPTGSGKSTTLYAMLSERIKLNHHIITVEDPVEYRLDGAEQVQIHSQIGYTFAEALRHILRHDPDDVLVGEMRDEETAEIAVRAALTGHFVLSTLHTNDAVSTITRLVDMGIEPYLVKSTLQGVMAQRLVRCICPNCREPLPEEDASLLGELGLDNSETWYHGAGCSQCQNSGIKGRRCVAELITLTPELEAMIDRQADAREMRALVRQQGMSTIEENALALARAGIIPLSEVLNVRL